ncbi:hypothetical protein EB837_21915, partial [Kluyvera ascorbata]
YNNAGNYKEYIFVICWYFLSGEFMEYFSFKKKLSVSFIAMLLTASSVQAARKPPPWVQFTGKGYQFCDALLKELKRFDFSQVAPNSRDACSRELIIPHFKQLKEPQWQMMDKELHRPLLRRLFTPEPFYQLGERKNEHSQEEEEEVEKRINSFIAGGGYLRMWKMPLPEWLEEEALRYKLPVTPLNFVQVAGPQNENHKKFIYSQCRGIPLRISEIWTGALYLVNDSLDGPEPRATVYMGQKHGNEMLTWFSRIIRSMVDKGGKLYLYRDIPHFSDSFGISFISSGKSSWINENYCEINWNDRLNHKE